MRKLFPVVCVFSCLLVAHSFAGSATWNLNPTNGDWNTAANWTPATVPNDPADTATFGVSQAPVISQLAEIDLNGMMFNPGASVYTISTTGIINISGTGVVNNSGVTQNVSLDVAEDGNWGTIYFTNNATSGDSVNYDVMGGPHADYFGGDLEFFDHSSAGSGGVFTTSGGLESASDGSYLGFHDESSAATATFICHGGFGGTFGEIAFTESSSLAESTVVVNGPRSSFGPPGVFSYSSTVPLVDVSVTTNGGTEAGFGGGYSYIDGPSAQGCSFISNGGNGSLAGGGYTQFNTTFDTDDSMLIANGGANGGNGGLLYLLDSSVVGGRVELFGNGSLVISSHDAPGAAVGSVEGDGIVTMGALNLTVGSNSLSTSFSGSLEGDPGSSLTKVGAGTLTLSGANNTYTDGTTIVSGTLKVNNTSASGTGSGVVKVNGGTLGGKGIIANTVTIGTGSGTGAFLQPGIGASTPTTLTIQKKLTFKSDGTYTYKLNTKKIKGDQVVAKGVTIKSGTQFDFVAVGNQKLTSGKVFTPISNTATTPISGTFANLADGSTVTVGVNKLQVSYAGGDGNDLTLTVVP